MPRPTRRDVLGATGAALAAGPAIAASPPDDTSTAIARDLDRFIGQGGKASGGPGDTACGAWLGAELAAAGYRTILQPFQTPWFAANTATLATGDTVAPVIPQGVVTPTGGGGVAGRLVRIDPVTGPAGPVHGAIAVLDLPAARWSSTLARPIRDPLDAAFAAGAVGAAIITNGPTGEAVALNAPHDRPAFAGPVGVLAPTDAAAFLRAAAQGETARLTIDGNGGTRHAANLIGRIDRGKPGWLVISTPRSGWFTCAGERGSGVVAWLALARWAAASITAHNLAFICTSGHEYEYQGAEIALRDAPSPAQTSLWLHLGANVAARDWHEAGARLLPLPSADPYRFLLTSPALLTSARRAFAGQPGLEAAYPVSAGTAGELSNIVAAGYLSVAGIFGAHRFHHSINDDGRCVIVPPIARVIAACKAMITAL